MDVRTKPQRTKPQPLILDVGFLNVYIPDVVLLTFTFQSLIDVALLYKHCNLMCLRLMPTL